MRKSFIIQGSFYRNANCTDMLETPIGPFETRPAAELFLRNKGPLWGSGEIVELTHPLDHGY